MRVIFIGTVEFSKKTLEKLIDLNVRVVGVCTKKMSNYNSDFSNAYEVELTKEEFDKRCNY